VRDELVKPNVAMACTLTVPAAGQTRSTILPFLLRYRSEDVNDSVLLSTLCHRHVFPKACLGVTRNDVDFLYVGDELHILSRDSHACLRTVQIVSDTPARKTAASWFGLVNSQFTP
jgi:hypothetical protein